MDSIDYPAIMKRAVQGVISDALKQVAEHGLPGDHHFVICFSTNHPDARVPEWIKKKHPDRMTIILQHWFENLAVYGHGFAVTLNFSDEPQDLHVPFDSILYFLDPSVKFALHLAEAPQNEEEAPDPPAAEQPPAGKTPSKAAPPGGGGNADNIVSLDQFRKGDMGKTPS